MTLDSFPLVNRPVYLPVPPTISVTSISYVDQNGTTQTLDPSAYLVDVTGEPARITPAYNMQWPVIRDQIAAVTIVYQAGYATVPEGLKHAMKMLARHYYENRYAVTDRPTSSVPMGVESLLSGYRWGNYG